MAPLSRKAQLQQFSWQLLEDLAFCSGRWPRLAELAAHRSTGSGTNDRAGGGSARAGAEVITVGEGLITAAPAVSPW
ncbi:MAG: hypothetical protein ACKO8I_11150, partial [Cyanobacteriota bacterium]